MGVDVNEDSVAGASARYIAESTLPDDVQKQIADDVGLPTDQFESGQHVEDIQKLSVGKRYYACNHPSSRRSGSSSLSTSPIRGQNHASNSGMAGNATNNFSYFWF